MSTKALLIQAGLGHYYPHFEKAGYQMLDVSKNLTDLQVEQLLAEVERHCGRRFLAPDRTRLWKALRHMWFRVTAHGAQYIDSREIPRLFLPKRDYKQIDWMVKFSDLDPDRQRQILRQTRSVSTPHGKQVENLQFELYQRQHDLWYEYQDIKRSVTEWTRMNARLMLREDPREEVLKLRIRGIVDRATLTMLDRKAVMQTRSLIMTILTGIRLVSAAIAVVMFVTAYVRFRNAPMDIMLGFIMGSQQFISGTSFVVVFAVAWTVANRWREDQITDRLKKLITSSDRLRERISDFRIETEDQRMSNAEAPKPSEVVPLGTQLQALQLPSPTQAKRPRELKRRKKKRREKDPVMQMWAPDLVRNKATMETIAKDLPSAYKALEPLPGNFRRKGGDRMWRFTNQLGNRLAGVEEDGLVRKVLGRSTDTAALLDGGVRLPELPDNPTITASDLRTLADVPRQPSLPPQLQLQGQRPGSGTGRLSSGAEKPSSASMTESARKRLFAPPAAFQDTLPPRQPPTGSEEDGEDEEASSA